MKNKTFISLFLGILISIAALYFAFRKVPFYELLNYLGSINYWWLLPSVGLVCLSFLGRALRWRAIIGVSHKLPFSHVFHTIMIGFMLNCILPARAGELARPAILQKKDRVPFTTGLATVATERVFDLFMLIALFTIMSAFIHIDPGLEIKFGDTTLNRTALEAIAGGMAKLSMVLIAGIIFISIDRIRKWITASIMAFPNVLFFGGPGLKKTAARFISYPMAGMVENIATGFRLLKDYKKICICLAISLGIWTVQAVSYYFMALGCPGLDLSFPQVTAVMIVICFFIALPSVPGFWGLWEAGGVFALSLFGVGAKDAAGFALASHGVQMFPVILIGIVSALVYGVNLKNISYEAKDSKDIKQHGVAHGNT